MIRTRFVSSIALSLMLMMAMLLASACSSGSGRNTVREETPMWKGPDFNATIEVMESQPPQYAVRYSATVPTGGWSMETDDITLVGGVLTLKVTLVKPTRHEIVTQAFETLRDQYLPGRSRVDVVNILARQHERGATPPNDYLLAFSAQRK